MPNHGRHRAPLPQQKRQRQARQQYISGALDRRRHELRPPSLELLARHDAVLQGEHRQQRQVDDDGCQGRRGDPGINGRWHDHAFDEADGVEKGGEKHRIGDQPVQERYGSSDQVTAAAGRVFGDGVKVCHGSSDSRCCRDQEASSLPLNATKRLCRDLDLFLRWACLTLENGLSRAEAGAMRCNICLRGISLIRSGASCGATAKRSPLSPRCSIF